MKSYLGIDIGTTNTKALVLKDDGLTEIVFAGATPKYTDKGIEYFDLKQIEQNVTQAIKLARERYEIDGISFSSVGESVVPIGNDGSVLSDPLVWYDEVTKKTKENLRKKVAIQYEKRGAEDNYTMGIYKMVWMEEHILQQTDVPYTFLPIADYCTYFLTGKKYWDYSQACRSLLVDIHRKRWDTELIKQAGIKAVMPELIPSGEYVGNTADEIPVFSGGHDHIVGMHGIQMLYGDQTLFFSFGSATVLGGFISGSHEDMELYLKKHGDITMGISYKDSEYYVENSLRYFGKLHDAVALSHGSEGVKEFYDIVNPIIEHAAFESHLPYFLVEGDRITKDKLEGYNIMNLRVGDDRNTIVYALYIYFGMMAAIIFQELASFFYEPKIVAGGGILKNKTMVQFICDVLDMPIYTIQEREQSALAAALVAVKGRGDTNLINLIQKNVAGTPFYPSKYKAKRQKQADAMRTASENMLSSLLNK